jgi:hypothetical protein
MVHLMTALPLADLYFTVAVFQSIEVVMSESSLITSQLVHFDLLVVQVGKEMSLALKFLAMVCFATTVIFNSASSN